jgi:hypothetical protein
MFLLAILRGYYGIDALRVFSLVETAYASQLALEGWECALVQQWDVLTDEELSCGNFVGRPLLVADC